MTAIDAGAKPRLPRGVRLAFDEARGGWILLAPERVIKIGQTGQEILKRCTGQTSLAAIIDDLALTYTADRAEIERDVTAFLEGLTAKRMVEL